MRMKSRHVDKQGVRQTELIIKLMHLRFYQINKIVFITQITAEQILRLCFLNLVYSSAGCWAHTFSHAFVIFSFSTLINSLLPQNVWTLISAEAFKLSMVQYSAFMMFYWDHLHIYKWWDKNSSLCWGWDFWLYSKLILKNPAGWRTRRTFPACLPMGLLSLGEEHTHTHWNKGFIHIYSHFKFDQWDTHTYIHVK